ncbi:MAG: alcohol dehydrogenase catalytic domain-containing protein [Cyanobacteria bacterium P01_H01_bin.74]
MQVAQTKTENSKTTFEIANRPCPELTTGTAVVDIAGCSLCGSDVEKLVNRKVPDGTVLGHEVVGQINALNINILNINALDTTKRFSVGDRVVFSHHVPCFSCQYCLNGSQSMCDTFKQSNIFPGGFAEQVTLSEAHLQHVTFKIPDAISFQEASCMEPLACVIQGVQRGNVFFKPLQSAVKKTVGVVGLGFIGLLAAQVYKHQGFHVMGVDINPARLALATAQQWTDVSYNPAVGYKNDAQVLAEMANVFNCKGEQETGVNFVGLDVVFLSVVTAKTLETAFSLLRRGGTIVVFASAMQTGTLPLQIDPNLLYFKEVSVISSYSPDVASLKQSADLIFSRTINVSPLLTHTVELTDIQSGVDAYCGGEAVKVFVKMPKYNSIEHFSK